VRSRILITLVAIAVVGSIALYATDATSPSTRHVVHAPYTTTEVLEFFGFSAGRVVADHPDLDQRGAFAIASDSQARFAAESVTGCIHRMDASAGPALTAAFNAADPQRIDGALQRVDAAARRWMTAPYKQDDPCPPPPPPPYEGPIQEPDGFWHMTGDIAGNYVLVTDDFYAFAVTVGGALVISWYGLVAVAMVVAAGLFLVPEFITYEFENASTDLDRQTAIAKLAKALRS
jgi:hypothetical protein